MMKYPGPWRTVAVLAPIFLLTEQTGSGQGIYRNGIGARAIALGGADAAFAEGPLGAMANNPAGLGSVNEPALEGSLLGGLLNGEFTNGANPAGARAADDFRFGGEGAFAMPLGKTPFTAGLAAIPEAALAADWIYNDTDPDGAAPGLVSYGRQRNKSEILVLRSALGLSYTVNDAWTVGASVGLIYNKNTLITPYIFQTHPALAGAKTLLNLKTDGFGVDGTVGALWKATESAQFGVSYQLPSSVRSHGDADGDASLQLGVPPGGGAFHYDAKVINRFPQIATAGVSWKASPQWRLAAQVDWIYWSDAFDDLQVKLSNGSNATINGALGSTDLNDQVPLRWKDQWVFRGGAEYDVCENWQLRGGYSYSRSPVPDAYLNPLVAAIMEHTLGFGVGWKSGRYSIDAAYQYAIPASQTSGTSGLRSGEYAGSKVEVSVHAIAVTAGLRF